MKNINRRDFLKLLAITAPTLFLGKAFPKFEILPLHIHNQNSPNIILILFDAMSARNLSVYGYERETTPNLKRISERGIVYNSHYSAGNFTTSGTASMYTGLYPWKHRAINPWGLIRRELEDNNIFSLIGDNYNKVAYSQNYLSKLLLDQFQSNINHLIPTTKFSNKPLQLLLSQYFRKDSIFSYEAYDKFLFKKTDSPGSMILGYLDLKIREKSTDGTSLSEDVGYPFGLPENTYYSFKNQDVYNGVFTEIINAVNDEKPFFAFFHLFSPHEPYAPRVEYVDKLENISTPYKPTHRLSSTHFQKREMGMSRQRYDEYISEVDSELGKLVNRLDSFGLLDNSYIILTSDHGEMFERGEIGHFTKLLFDPVIHIPLIIIDPKNKKRRDVNINTCNIDILPTILHITGQEIPSIIDGKPLPELGGTPDFNRPIFSMEAKENSAFAPLKKMILKKRKMYLPRNLE